jgi:hypothetical protein
MVISEQSPPMKLRISWARTSAGACRFSLARGKACHQEQRAFTNNGKEMTEARMHSSRGASFPQLRFGHSTLTEKI